MNAPESMRALVVEDDPVLARSLARRLLREGYTVSLASTCRAARAAGGDFHVAVLDLDLPDGSGASLADYLRAAGAVGQIVFYTGSLDPEQRRRAQEYGPVVDKGTDLEAVVAALEPEPPASQLTPAQRPRPRPSGARLTRVQPEAEAVAESVATTSSSRR